MKVVDLTIRQRFNLEALLGAQRGGYDDAFVFYEIRKKIRVAEPERELYVKELPDGRVIADEKAIEAGPVATVSLENGEVRKLLDVIKNWTGFTPIDYEWVGPLREALEAK